MTIHSISIEPCSLSISKRRINWPLLFPSFLSMIAVLFMFVQLSYPKYRTMLASASVVHWTCVLSVVYRIQFSKAIVIILFCVLAYNLCRWQNFIGRETISLQTVANCPRTRRGARETEIDRGKKKVSRNVKRTQLENCRLRYADLSFKDVTDWGSKTTAANLYAPNGQDTTNAKPLHT